ncbi:PREDICTED: insulin-like growth factor-binding protein 1 [Myotis brandtii]|uniref:insulin-like growth factor-binding protein 1 n=1 Tax=Myotis brandtii TaxID=109478 RepID=UPI000703F931|nr:PREDICTED: insulin-like growth factor-binding protein 1 [Myotis brandtii]
MGNISTAGRWHMSHVTLSYLRGVAETLPWAGERRASRVEPWLPSWEGSRPVAPSAEAEEANPEGLPSVWSALSSYESIRALGISDIKNWKDPCQRELYDVLAKLAQERTRVGDGLYKFYLPNCHKNGLYHSKQCMVSLHGETGVCWCVYPWNGQRIVGSKEVIGDPNCDQYFPKADAA